MSGIDRAIAYKTMRAVQAQNPQTPRKPSWWQRWKAAVTRITDRLAG